MSKNEARRTGMRKAGGYVEGGQISSGSLWRAVTLPLL